MDFYSVTLALALAAAIAALGLALFAPRAARGVRRLVVWTGVAALVLVVLSGLNHVVAGHPPGSPSALGAAAFLAEHPALPATAALAIAALVLRWKTTEGFR